MPHLAAYAGSYQPLSLQGWMTVLRSSFHVGVQVGSGHAILLLTPHEIDGVGGAAGVARENGVAHSAMQSVRSIVSDPIRESS